MFLPSTLNATPCCCPSWLATQKDALSTCLVAPLPPSDSASEHSPCPSTLPSPSPETTPHLPLCSSFLFCPHLSLLYSLPCASPSSSPPRVFVCSSSNPQVPPPRTQWWSRCVRGHPRQPQLRQCNPRCRCHNRCTGCVRQYNIRQPRDWHVTRW